MISSRNRPKHLAAAKVYKARRGSPGSVQQFSGQMYIVLIYLAESSIKISSKSRLDSIEIYLQLEW